MSLKLHTQEWLRISDGYDAVASRSRSIHSDCYLEPQFLQIEREQVVSHPWYLLHCHVVAVLLWIASSISTR